MEFREGKFSFIKHHVSRDINTTRGDFQTLEPFLHGTVTKKCTLFVPKLQLVAIVGQKIRIACTTKNS
jgi:hypothetical protein